MGALILWGLCAISFGSFTLGAYWQSRVSKRRKTFEPMALKLLPSPATVSASALVEAISAGRADMLGRCTHCGGDWNATHENRPHPVPMPLAGPGERRRG